MSSVASLLSSTAAAVSSAAVSPSPTARATPQGGILEGSNPSVYDPKNPIFLFIIQVRRWFLVIHRRASFQWPCLLLI